MRGPADLGLYLAYLTIPRTPADDDRWRWYNAPAAPPVTLRPDNVGTIRAILGSSPTSAASRSSTPRARSRSCADLRDAGWAAERVLAALDERPSTSTPSARPGCPVDSGRWRWSGTPPSARRRSAGWAPASPSSAPTSSPASSPRTRPPRGLRRFEATMRPYVDRAQKLPPGTRAPRVPEVPPGSPRCGPRSGWRAAGRPAPGWAVLSIGRRIRPAALRVAAGPGRTGPGRADLSRQLVIMGSWIGEQRPVPRPPDRRA